MATTYDAADVFRPRAFPTLTYVTRAADSDDSYETMLQRALRTPGTLISVTGASKTGKTVLCHKVLPEDRILLLGGGQIRTIDDFWEQIAERLDLPIEWQVTHTATQANAIKGEGSGSAGLPLVGQLHLGGGSSRTTSQGENIAYKVTRNKSSIIKNLIDHQRTLIIDDFHYIDSEVQLYIARVLKAEIFNGLRVILLSLPHRADDAIRLNPDLIGRTAFIDLAPWTEADLTEIARKGFQLLHIHVPDEFLVTMAAESASSPQLMQEICLNLALDLQDAGQSDVAAPLLQKIFRRTAKNYQHYRDVLQDASHGPSQGRTHRKQYPAPSGKIYDVYSLLLTSIALDPPILRLSLDEIRQRMVRLLGSHDIPAKLTIANAIKHIAATIRAALPKHDTIDVKNNTLYILDPLLLFYLRWDDSWKSP